MTLSRPDTYAFGPFVLDVAAQKLTRDGVAISLSPKVFDTLVALVRAEGRVVSKDDLMKTLWPDSFVEEANLTQNIFVLRKALGEGQSFIETVPRRGYRFTAPAPAATASAQSLAGSERPGLHQSARPGLRFGIAAGLVLAIGALVLVLWTSRPPFAQFAITAVTTSRDVNRAAISPDGRFLATASVEGATVIIRLRQLATGTTVEVARTPGTTARSLSFAPDGEHLYFAGATDAAFRVATIGGTPVQVANNARGQVVESPDGKRLAYVAWWPERGERALVITDAEGRNGRSLLVRRAPESPVWEGHAWSPDSRYVAIVVTAGSGAAGARLIEVNVETGEERVVASGLPWNAGSVAWHPDGTGIFLTAAQIWYISREDGARRRVTTDTAHYRSISITADGQTLAAVQSTTTSTIHTATWPTLESPRTLLNDAGIINGIAWLPDDRVVYLSYASGDPELWITGRGRSGPTQLTRAPGRDIYPAVPADGRFIAYSSSRDEGAVIWRMQPDGTGEKRLSGEGAHYGASVSRDGSLVAYHRADETQSWTVWVVASDGGTPRRVTDRPSTFPTFSPDGRSLACNYLVDGAWKIAIVPVEGGAPSRVLDVAGEPTRRLTWAPDGSGIVAAHSLSITLVPLDGSAPRTLLTSTGQPFQATAFSPDGKRFAWVDAKPSEDAVILREIR